MANNPNASDNLTHPRWEPGKSANPGGKTSEQKRREMANAEAATKIVERRLAAIVSAMDADPNHVPEIDAVMRALIKDAQDRGLGAPKQTLAGDDEAPLRVIKRVIVDPEKPE